MKVGIVTFHFAYNYGAVLQAWALQKFLKNLGLDSEIVDYRPYYHTERYGIIRNIFLAGKNTYKKRGFNLYLILRAIIGTIIENIVLLKSRITKKKYFEDFFEQSFKLSKRYLTIDEIIKDGINYDALIAGSDQIWNKKLTNGIFDAPYFLQFGQPATKRIAYAVSLGETSVTECCDYLESLGFQFSEYSCREKTDAVEFENVLKCDCINVCDPTLLLSASDYSDIECKDLGYDKYYLVYILKNNETLNSSIKYLVEKGLRVIDISPEHQKINGVIYKHPVKPSEFISYIKHSEFILTNSFHGTVFSLIYNKQFACGLHGTRNNRITGLLEKVGLDDRILKDHKTLPILLNNPINYKEANKCLVELSKESMSYLKKAIYNE